MISPKVKNNFSGNSVNGSINIITGLIVFIHHDKNQK
jgi:hypothetical protein